MVQKPRNTSRAPKRSKFVLASILIVFLALLSGGSYFALQAYHNHTKRNSDSWSTRPVNTVNYSPPSPDDNTANDERKSSSNPATTLDNGPTQTSSDSTINAQITGANLTSNNANVHIGTLVSGTTSGTCTLTASQNGQQTLNLASASVEQDVNQFDCGVFNIPTSQFPATGTWKLTLTVSVGGQQNSSTTSLTIP
jgi:hypothetical protein